jgi:hypothetical protein
MELVMKVKRKDVWHLVSDCFPAYKGRKFRVEVTKKVTFYDLNWSGGSRNEYASADIETGKKLGSMKRFEMMHPMDNVAEGKSVDLPEGAIIVRHSIFCGHDTGITIFINPSDTQKALSQEVVSKMIEGAR